MSFTLKVGSQFKALGNPVMPPSVFPSNEETIPHICHGRHGHVRVNFFWPVLIFTDLTRKIGIFDIFYAKKWRFFLQI